MKHPAWQHFAEQIKDCPLDQLTKNSAFCQTMYSTAHLKPEMEYLLQYFGRRRIEDIAGEKVPNMGWENNVHQLYHMMHYLNTTKMGGFHTEPENEFAFAPFSGRFLPPVLEFGAGYGSFCKTAYRFGLCDTYNIVDLPELRELQKRYLAYHDIKNVTWFESFPKYFHGTFIALWSLSETPKEVREQIMEEANFQSYLFAYGESFYDMSNYEYFDEFAKRRNHMIWDKIKIPFMDGQYYLIGHYE